MAQNEMNETIAMGIAVRHERAFSHPQRKPLECIDEKLFLRSFFQARA